VRIAVIGAGVAGLGASLSIARGGHDVVLLERDATPLPHTPDEAFEWQRRGAPQVRHSHAFLARLRNLLRDRLPDVRDELLGAGAIELRWSDFLPDTIDDSSPKPGDDDLALICCRRTTFEWVLRRAAAHTDRVDLRDGTIVTGLVTDGGNGVPRVIGVSTDHGDVDADVVLDATGRPSKLPEMLRAIGVRIDEKKSPSGIVYLSRFYRLRDDATPPDSLPLNGGDLVYLKYAVFRADNDTFSVTLAYATDDADMRTLRDRGRFDSATQAIPAIRAWMDPRVSEPISGVHYMGNLINRVRRTVVHDDVRVHGLHAIGDSAVCTNPLYGRGCALGLAHGVLFADALREHGDDAHAIAMAFAEATEDELVPWYAASVDSDDAAMKLARGEELDGPHAWARTILSDGLLPATQVDADVSRAWFRTFNLLAKPDALLTNERVVQRALEFYNDRDSRPAPEPLGPPRDEFLGAIA
jgi:2-polyprenyl-6-methoxyphenol hydroxylase-like FAD-dependent oxidoreductase